MNPLTTVNKTRIYNWLYDMYIHYAMKPQYTVESILHQCNTDSPLDSEMRKFDIHDDRVIKEVSSWLRRHKASRAYRRTPYKKLESALGLFFGVSFEEPPRGAIDFNDMEDNQEPVIEDLGTIFKALSARLFALEAKLT